MFSPLELSTPSRNGSHTEVSYQLESPYGISSPSGLTCALSQVAYSVSKGATLRHFATLTQASYSAFAASYIRVGTSRHYCRTVIGIQRDMHLHTGCKSVETAIRLQAKYENAVVVVWPCSSIDGRGIGGNSEEAWRCWASGLFGMVDVHPS